jgi:hypothetical protein
MLLDGLTGWGVAGLLLTTGMQRGVQSNASAEAMSE